MLHRRYSFVVLFLIMSWFLYMVVGDNRDRYVKEHLNAITNTTYLNFMFIYNNQKDLAELIFKAGINTPEVIELFKNRQRKELHNYLEKSYTQYKEFSIRQLHFHLPNNDSFLRMHRPEKFGDNLSSVRATVKYVNENKKYIDSFEEGRVFNGFRFVYPLFDKDEHIGSVEISLSALVFIKNFVKNYNMHSNFHIAKNVVHKKVLQDERSNYMQSRLSDYYLEKAIVDYLKMDKLRFDFYQKEIDVIQKKIKEGNAFSLYLDRYKEIVTFVPLKNNISSEIIATLSFAREDTVIEDIKNNAITIYIISISSLALILILIYRELKYKQKLERDVSKRTEELHTLNGKLKDLSEKDALTGVYNRRYLYHAVKVLSSLSKRNKSKISIAMIDIDNFKSINDTHGHDVGDKVLKCLASIVVKSIRESDVFVRYGGEEFILLLPDTSLEQSISLLEKIRVTVESSEVVKEINVTVSIGVSEFKDNIDDSIKKADNAMYEAKTTGKNRVCKDEG